MNKLKALLLLAVALNLQKIMAQVVTPYTSFGAGKEIEHRAVPVQLSAGINFNQAEVVIGYAAFFHKYDAKLPKIIFVRAGMNLTQGSWEILPLIGMGLITATVYDAGILEQDLKRTPQEFKILAGLKVQKLMGLGGLFASIEHCKYNFAIFGIFVKIA